MYAYIWLALSFRFVLLMHFVHFLAYLFIYRSYVSIFYRLHLITYFSVTCNISYKKHVPSATSTHYYCFFWHYNGFFFLLSNCIIQDFKNHIVADNHNKLDSSSLFPQELNPRLELMVTKEGQPSHPTFLLVCMSCLAYRRVWPTFFFETLRVCA